MFTRSASCRLLAFAITRRMSRAEIGIRDDADEGWPWPQRCWVAHSSLLWLSLALGLWGCLRRLIFVALLWNLYSLWFICSAPVRGGTHFLCCCKESKQRKQLPTANPCHAPPGRSLGVVQPGSVVSEVSSLLACRRGTGIAPLLGVDQQSYIRLRATRSPVCKTAPATTLVQGLCQFERPARGLDCRGITRRNGLEMRPSAAPRDVSCDRCHSGSCHGGVQVYRKADAHVLRE